MILHIFRGNIAPFLHIFRGNIALSLHIFRGNVVSPLTIPAEWQQCRSAVLCLQKYAWEFEKMRIWEFENFSDVKKSSPFLHCLRPTFSEQKARIPIQGSN